MVIIIDAYILVIAGFFFANVYYKIKNEGIKISRRNIAKHALTLKAVSFVRVDHSTINAPLLRRANMLLALFYISTITFFPLLYGLHLLSLI